MVNAKSIVKAFENVEKVLTKSQMVAGAAFGNNPGRSGTPYFKIYKFKQPMREEEADLLSERAVERISSGSVLFQHYEDHWKFDPNDEWMDEMHDEMVDEFRGDLRDLQRLFSSSDLFVNNSYGGKIEPISQVIQNINGDISNYG